MLDVTSRLALAYETNAAAQVELERRQQTLAMTWLASHTALRDAYDAHRQAWARLYAALDARRESLGMVELPTACVESLHAAAAALDAEVARLGIPQVIARYII
jgi:hypothetical protein